MAVTVVSVLLHACESYRSIDGFYEAHRNDNQVIAFRVPKFMFSLLGQISPGMNSLIGTTRDIRYMSFPSALPERTRFLNHEMDQVTGSSFIEVYRKNDDLKRNVVSVREKGNTVREILIYTNNNVNGSFLYFNGRFDPLRVRALAQDLELQSLGDTILGAMGTARPSEDQ